MTIAEEDTTDRASKYRRSASRTHHAKQIPQEEGVWPSKTRNVLHTWEAKEEHKGDYKEAGRISTTGIGFPGVVTNLNHELAMNRPQGLEV
jgi:hypothetical protein